MAGSACAPPRQQSPGERLFGTKPSVVQTDGLDDRHAREAQWGEKEGAMGKDARSSSGMLIANLQDDEGLQG